MTPTCWQPTSSKSGGKCLWGYFHGRPSFLDCQNCPDGNWPTASSREAGIVFTAISISGKTIDKTSKLGEYKKGKMTAEQFRQMKKDGLI